MTTLDILQHCVGTRFLCGFFVVVVVLEIISIIVSL